MLSKLNSPKDSIPCCIRTYLYLRSSYRCCRSQEQFWWIKSDQHQGSLQLDRCCLSPLCVFVQVGVITRHNHLASKPVMVLLEIYCIYYWNRHCKNCNDEWWVGGVSHWKTNFYRCSNKSVLVLNGICFCFGNPLDFINVVYHFLVHPSCQEIFLF